tara:strand:- start:109 stop:246 length:138 start_codon:yes stop_codon:yes gene_type:complete
MGSTLAFLLVESLSKSGGKVAALIVKQRYLWGATVFFNCVYINVI